MLVFSFDMSLLTLKKLTKVDGRTNNDHIFKILETKSVGLKL